MHQKLMHSNFIPSVLYFGGIFIIRGGADKSLARPEKKQSTATKLEIYSKYSTRSSIHFSARSSNFCKPPKKKNETVVRPTRSPRQKWPPRRTKNGDFSILFSVQGSGGTPTGSDPENRVGDQDNGSPGRQVYSGLQVPGEPGQCHARTRTPGDISVAFSLQNVLQLNQQRWVLLPVDSLAFWKLINEEDAVLIPTNRGEKFSKGFLHSEFFGAGWAAMPPLLWLLFVSGS